MVKFGFMQARVKESPAAATDTSRNAGGRLGRYPQAETADALLLLQNFEDSGQGWFWATDASGRLTYLSDSIRPLLTAGADTMIGLPFTDFFVRVDDGGATHRTLPFILTKHSSFEKLTLRIANSKDERWWAVSGQSQFDSAGSFLGYRGYGVDITEQLRSSEYASQLALNDPLTGLPNRLAMSRVLESSLVAAAHQGRPCAVMLIDLDRFKQVNDTLGHPAGDALLRQVADRLLRIIGDKEKVFRLGGDEFQIILPNCDDRGTLGGIANEIIASLSQPYSIEGSRCVIGASVGAAIGLVDGRNSDELTRNVDLALYAAKGSGRGRFRFFSSELLQAADDKRILEEDLRDALTRGEMSVAYQPIVNARTNCVTGVEALIRWDHPKLGQVSPATFIPIAEEANLIGPLGEWVLRRACEDAMTWPGHLRVAVNISPIQFMNESLPRIVMAALARSGLAPERLELELTEGVFLGDSAETDSMFATLKQIGVRMALDDFGTGYSSLGYLKTAPFDKIKIDQSFVRGATMPGSRNGAIIAAIVALAGALEMETTAEGIESLDQLDLIRKLGVSHVQGFVYGKAIPSSALSQNLENGDWTISPTGPARQRSDRQSMFRKAGAIVSSHYQPVLIRNLSETGALIEGLMDVPIGTRIVLDLGDGQLTMAIVRRVTKRQHGVEFGVPLVSDGDGGLCTAHRVSPYVLGTLGIPGADVVGAKQLWDPAHAPGFDELAAKLGLRVPSMPVQQGVLTRRSSGDPGRSHGAAGGTPAMANPTPTVESFSARYLDHFKQHKRTHRLVEQAIQDHILPQFGQLPLDQIAQADVAAWLSSKAGETGAGVATIRQLNAIMSYMFVLAGRWGVMSADNELLQQAAAPNGGYERNLFLTEDEVERLSDAAEASHNPQLKFIVALLPLTRIRIRELLDAHWDDIDLEEEVWRVPSAKSGTPTELRLSAGAIELIRQLPRWNGCPHVITNPRTRKPYRSLFKSWDTCRKMAALPNLSIDDLRYSAPRR